MDGEVTVIALVVSNQQKALDFYTQKAGFEKKTDVTPYPGGRWVTVGMKGQPLELALWEVGSATDPAQKELASQWAPARAPPIVVKVPDARAVYEELRARGVEFLAPVQEYAWGTNAVFRDPDGNLISISQPPGSGPKA